MIAHEPPFNWVKARVDCDSRLIFQALLDVVRRDVDEINRAEPGKRHGFQFNLHESPEGTIPRFVVGRTHPNYTESPPRGAVFERHPTIVKIILHDEVIEIVPVWDEATSSCRFTIDDIPYKVCQVAQKALSRLFFNG